MARVSRRQVVDTIEKLGMVLVFYHATLETCKKIATAYYKGGGRVLEFTNRGEGAWLVFAELIKWCAQEFPNMILGAGSVIDAFTAAIYINSGAKFIVGPTFDEAIARLCNKRGVLYCPGCGSATEVSTAQELGCEIVKIFPGDSVGGPTFIKSVRGPMPWTEGMPTGGVKASLESIADWFKNGQALAVGIGSDIVNDKVLAQSDSDVHIETQTTQVLRWIRQARGVPLFLGVEHVGVYHDGSVSAEDVADWYANHFGLTSKGGKSSVFVSSTGPGRIEVMKEPAVTKAHVAILVSDFDAAVAVLQAKGIELEEPKISADGRTKAIFLKLSDPAGYPVHLIWQQQQ